MGCWCPVMQYATVSLSHIGYKNHKFTGQHGHGKAGSGSFTCGCSSTTSSYTAVFTLNITVPLDTVIKMTRLFLLISHSDCSFWFGIGFLIEYN